LRRYSAQRSAEWYYKLREKHHQLSILHVHGTLRKFGGVGWTKV
jgi:hypothetical protein